MNATDPWTGIQAVDFNEMASLYLFTTIRIQTTVYHKRRKNT